MKKSYEVVLNNLKNEDKSWLFGKESKIVVNSLKYSTNSKKFILDCKLLIKDPQLLVESYPDGIIYLAQESWKIMGFEQDLDVISTLELID